MHSVGHEQLPGQRRGQPGQPARGARGVRRGESRPGAGRHALSIGRHQTAVTVRSDAAARRALRKRDLVLGKVRVVEVECGDDWFRVHPIRLHAVPGEMKERRKAKNIQHKITEKDICVTIVNKYCQYTQ